MQMIENRQKNKSKKWDREYIEKRFGTRREDVLPLFIADMDYAHSGDLKEKYLEWTAKDDFGYFNVPDSFFESIIEWKRYKHDITLQKDWILPATGTISGLHLAAAALSSNGNDLQLLSFTPVYGGFKGIGEAFGVLNTLDLENQEIPFDLLEKEIVSKKIEVIVFCNPHNPIGKVWAKKELTQLVEIAKKYDVFILSDEIHSDFIFEGEFTSLAEYFDDYDKIIISDSANKTFNLSGLHSSYLISPNLNLLEKIQKEMDRYHIGINRVGMAFTEISYRYGKTWHEEVLQQVEKNAKYVKENLDYRYFDCANLNSSYLLWIKLRDDSILIDDFIIDLAQKTGVLLETGSRFIANYEHYFRFNLASDFGVIKEAVKKMNEYIRSSV